VPTVSLQRRGELVREVFAVLRDRPEGMPAVDVLREVERRLPPNDYEASGYERNPNVRRYEKVIRFSSINVVKAGWLVKNRGIWGLSEEGVRAFAQYQDPEQFYREAVRLYREWIRGREPDDVSVDEDTEEAAAATTLEEAEEAAWREIRQYVGGMPPYDFQDMVAGLLKAMGYHVAWVAPPGPDRGIDLIAYTDPLGTANPRIVVQVKRRIDSKIAADELRSFMAVLGDRDVGIFISVGGFTSEAEREARSQERRRLTLLDLNRFVELWIEHYSSLDEDDRQRLPLKPVHFLSPGA
jgi:restriction system protein